MSSLILSNLSKSFGSRTLFQGVSLKLSPGHRVALAGSNGTGKSTLLRIITGEERPDTGNVTLQPAETGLGYSSQEFEATDLQRPLLRWVLDGLPSWAAFWDRWSSAGEHSGSALEHLAREQNELEYKLGYNPEHRARAVLHGLGFRDHHWEQPVQTLSGGWRERARLARVLFQGTDVLLLDEPTNHLDLEGVLWLESFLSQFPGVLVFVAHERIFLDRVCNQVLMLGGAKPVHRPGNLSAFMAWKEEQDAFALKQQDKLDQEIRHRKHYVDRFRYKADKARQAQSRLKQIAQLEQEKRSLELGQPSKTLSFAWPEPKRSNQTVLSVHDLRFSFDHGAELWSGLEFTVFRGQKIGLVGPNGCGKTTLLKLVNRDLRPQSGRISMGGLVAPGYFSQHLNEQLDPRAKVLQEIRRLCPEGIREEEVRSVLGLFLLGESTWERAVGDLSGGEKNRLMLASLFLSRANFLILDEPTNHLDLESRQALSLALQQFSGTILMVAHDRTLLQEVAEEIWVLGRNGMEVQNGGFEAYAQSLMTPDRADAGQTQDSAPKRDRVKDRKRREAEHRNQLYRELKPKKERYHSLESELEALMARQEDLELRLADPSTYEDSQRVEDMNREYARIVARNEDILADLELLESEIADLDARGVSVDNLK